MQVNTCEEICETENALHCLWLENAGTVYATVFHFLDAKAPNEDLTYQRLSPKPEILKWQSPADNGRWSSGFRATHSLCSHLTACKRQRVN